MCVFENRCTDVWVYMRRVFVLTCLRGSEVGRERDRENIRRGVIQ